MEMLNVMDPIFDGLIQSSIIPEIPVNFYLELAGKRLPDDIFAELKGIADAFAGDGLRLDSLVKSNVFYELVTACTSIVARDPTDGHLFLGRNFDWGGGFGK